VSKKRRGRASKYTDAFKRQLVAESHSIGATVPMVSKQHGVPTSRIYSWRGDARFQPSEVETPGFVAVEVSDAPKHYAINHLLPEARIEITLEKARGACWRRH
jgi:transposase